MLLLTTPIEVRIEIPSTANMTHARIRNAAPNYPDREPTAREIADGTAERIISVSRGKVGYPTIAVVWSIGTVDRGGTYAVNDVFKETIPHPDASQILTRLGDPSEASDVNASRAIFNWLANNGYPELVGVVS
jgi:hypothetical protein